MTCQYRSDCPVLYELRDLPKTEPDYFDEPVRPKRDSARNISRGMTMAGIPKSELTLKIPTTDLYAFPPDASFHGKKGQ